MKYMPSIVFLRYFLSAGQSNSISKAAKDNFVTQSAISQAINKLETALGKQLISHEKNRFQLTPEGHLLLEKCKAIFAVFSEIEDAFNETDGIFKGRLSFACTHSFALSLLPPHLGKLSQVWPAVEPVLRLAHTDLIIEQVKKGEVDFGIVLDNEDFSQFHTREIYKGEYKLYRSKQMLDRSLKRLIMSEERREVSLLRQHFHSLEMAMDDYIEVSSWEVIASLTEQRLGIGFLPDYVAGKRNLVPCPWHPQPNIPYRILAIFSKHKELSRNAKMFISLICGE